MHSSLKRVVPVVLALLLAACGGGGSSVTETGLSAGGTVLTPVPDSGGLVEVSGNIEAMSASSRCRA